MLPDMSVFLTSRLSCMGHMRAHAANLKQCDTRGLCSLHIVHMLQAFDMGLICIPDTRSAYPWWGWLQPHSVCQLCPANGLQLSFKTTATLLIHSTEKAAQERPM